MDYEDLLPKLTKAKVRYLVVGAVGGILSGYFRATADLDLLVALDRKNLTRVVDFFTDRKYVPRIPVAATDLLDESNRKRWWKEKHMRVFTFIDPAHPLADVDLLIYSCVKFEPAWKRRQIVRIKNVPVHVASLNDLIKLKEDAARNRSLLKDWHDLEALKNLQRRMK